MSPSSVRPLTTPATGPAAPGTITTPPTAGSGTNPIEVGEELAKKEQDEGPRAPEAKAAIEKFKEAGLEPEGEKGDEYSTTPGAAPDPISLGPLTGNPRVELKFSGLPVEAEQVTGAGFLMMADFLGEEHKAYGGDYIMYFLEPSEDAPDPNKYYPQVVGAKFMEFLEMTGVVELPEHLSYKAKAKAAQEEKEKQGENQPRSEDDLARDIEEQNRIVFEKYRWAAVRNHAKTFTPRLGKEGEEDRKIQQPQMDVTSTAPGSQTPIGSLTGPLVGKTGTTVPSATTSPVQAKIPPTPLSRGAQGGDTLREQEKARIGGASAPTPSEAVYDSLSGASPSTTKPEPASTVTKTPLGSETQAKSESSSSPTSKSEAAKTSKSSSDTTKK